MAGIKLTVTHDERNILISAVDLAIASAKRATKSRQIDIFKDAAEKHEKSLQALRLKLA